MLNGTPTPSTEEVSALVQDKSEDLPENRGRVWIDRYEYLAPAGSEALQWEVREKHALPFHPSFFKAVGARPQDCKLLDARGDSMEPFLFHLDAVMIDDTQTQVLDGGIYAVMFEGEALIKQLFKEAGGRIRLHSYNPNYPDRILSVEDRQNFRVVGRCIHRSGAGPAL